MDASQTFRRLAMEHAEIQEVCSGYVRQVIIDDAPGWAFFNSDGDIEFASENRSLVFFFAAEHEFVVKMVH